MFTGYGGLSLSIEGPSKADIECHDNEDGTCRVTYKPTEPGTYIINIKFADEHVPGTVHLIIIPPQNKCFGGYTGISLSVLVSVCVQKY